MKLGIMSDSHGRLERVRQALAVFEPAGAEAIIHCGDVGGMEILEELAGRRCWFVWGNTDYPQPGWRSQVEALGLSWPDGPLELTLDGRRVAVFHGHERVFARAVRGDGHDYLFYGHSHHRDDRRAGGMRIINPGALHRVSVPTVAVLDLGSDELQFLELR